jgi:hypothetical protein
MTLNTILVFTRLTLHTMTYAVLLRLAMIVPVRHTACKWWPWFTMIFDLESNMSTQNLGTDNQIYTP